MTKKFRFRNFDIELDIEGTIYRVKPTTELSKKTVAFRDTINDFMQKALKGDADLESLGKTCRPIIDGILGDGASDAIFADRTPTPFDYADLVSYIATEITQYYNGQAPTNDLPTTGSSVTPPGQNVFNLYEETRPRTPEELARMIPK